MADFPFPSTIIDLTGVCENPGDSSAQTGHVDVSSYEVGEKEFLLPQGVDFDVVFTNAGDGILLSGMVRAQVQGTCDRCLDLAEFDIAGEMNEYLLFSAPENPDVHDGDFEVLGEDRLIDLSFALHDAVVMDTPFVVLCQPDCKGLCPVCGTNLNHKQCRCVQQAADARVESSDNPFAVLKNLKLD